MPKSCCRGLTGNDSRYYGNFGGTKVTILLFWLSIKRTRCTSYITCNITVCYSSFAKIHIKSFRNVYSLHGRRKKGRGRGREKSAKSWGKREGSACYKSQQSWTKMLRKIHLLCFILEYFTPKTSAVKILPPPPKKQCWRVTGTFLVWT